MLRTLVAASIAFGCLAAQPALAGEIYSVLAGDNVEHYDASTLQYQNFITTAASGDLTVGNDSIYVSSASAIYRYSMAGVLEATSNLPAGYTVGSIAVDGDEVYSILSGDNVEHYDATTLQYQNFITTAASNDLAVGDGSIYVSSTSAIYRYSMAGVLEATSNLPAGFTVGSIAVDGDEVYSILAGDNVEFYDATTLQYQNFISTAADNDLAVGDGSIYVSSTSQIYRYNMAGVLEATSNLPAGFTVGSIALAPSPAAAAVPEPDAWVLVLCGVGSVGGLIRGRRRSRSEGDAATA